MGVKNWGTYDGDLPSANTMGAAVPDAGREWGASGNVEAVTSTTGVRGRRLKELPRAEGGRVYMLLDLCTEVPADTDGSPINCCRDRITEIVVGLLRE